MDDQNNDAAKPASFGACAMRFVEIVTEIAREAKLPGYGIEAWNRLAPLVAMDQFLLVGRGKQQLDWAGAVAAMDKWARISSFDSALRRLEEVGALVFMELDEWDMMENPEAKLRTMTVFEFDAVGKLFRIDAFR